MSCGSHDSVGMLKRFIPQTSEMSIGAIDPRNRDARKEETREMREVEAYSVGWSWRNRKICGPVKRW